MSAAAAAAAANHDDDKDGNDVYHEDTSSPHAAGSMTFEQHGIFFPLDKHTQFIILNNTKTLARGIGSNTTICFRLSTVIPSGLSPSVPVPV